jgi:hypothetical protein
MPTYCQVHGAVSSVGKSPIGKLSISICAPIFNDCVEYTQKNDTWVDISDKTSEFLEIDN